MDFEQTLDLAREGDAAAWTDLYDSLAGNIKGYAQLRGSADPDDIVGETFLQLARHLHGFEGSQAGFRSWAFTIAHHRIIDERRRGTRRAIPAGEEIEAAADAASSPSAESLAIESIEMLEAATLLRPLTDNQQSVILLRVLANLSVAETAEVLGRSPGSIRVLHHRAIQALREQVASDHPVESVRRGESDA